MTLSGEKITKENRCGDCTLCCRLLEVPELKKPANQECIHCAINKGCKIWKKRPQVCQSFECAYYQMDKAHTDLRPDNCKVIFERINDNIFFGTQDPRYEMTNVAKNQIVAFNNQGFSVIISIRDKRQDFYIASNHTEKQIKKEYKKCLKDRYGRT